MRAKPDARTIDPTLVGVREWKGLGLNSAIPCTISNKHPKSRLRGAVVQIIGPGESDLKKAKVVNRIIMVNNKNLMVKIIRMNCKSNIFKPGKLVEIKPKLLIPLFKVKK